jgi:hypothetical protein
MPYVVLLQQSISIGVHSFLCRLFIHSMKIHTCCATIGLRDDFWLENTSAWLRGFLEAGCWHRRREKLSDWYAVKPLPSGHEQRSWYSLRYRIELPRVIERWLPQHNGVLIHT